MAEQCSICLEDLSNNQKITSCLHVFHISCIDTWLENNVTCPVCRSRLREGTPTNFWNDDGFLPQIPLNFTWNSEGFPLPIPRQLLSSDVENFFELFLRANSIRNTELNNIVNINYDYNTIIQIIEPRYTIL